MSIRRMFAAATAALATSAAVAAAPVSYTKSSVTLGRDGVVSSHTAFVVPDLDSRSVVTVNGQEVLTPETISYVPAALGCEGASPKMAFAAINDNGNTYYQLACTGNGETHKAKITCGGDQPVFEMTQAPAGSGYKPADPYAAVQVAKAMCLTR